VKLWDKAWLAGGARGLVVEGHGEPAADGGADDVALAALGGDGQGGELGDVVGAE